VESFAGLHRTARKCSRLTPSCRARRAESILMTTDEGENTMTRQKRDIPRRKFRTSFTESIPNTPCPRWIQRRMRANLNRSKRCSVSPRLATRAAEILAQANRKSKSVIQEQCAGLASSATRHEAIPHVSMAIDSSRHQVAQSRRGHHRFKDIAKSAVHTLKQRAFPRFIKLMGRRASA